jgi:hypothetical protein
VNSVLSDLWCKRAFKKKFNNLNGIHSRLWFINTGATIPSLAEIWINTVPKKMYKNFGF